MAYVLCPGHVLSDDGDWHWISARELAVLYGVNFAECKVYPPDSLGYRKKDGDIHLHPRDSGNYTLTNC